MTIKYCDRCGTRIINTGNSDIIMANVTIVLNKHDKYTNSKIKDSKTMDLCYSCANSFAAWMNSPLFKADPLREIDLNKEYTDESN